MPIDYQRNVRFYIHIPTGVGGIYAISNLLSGQVYVGSSWNVRNRLSAHLSRLYQSQHSNRKLQAAWNSYGADAFAFALLEEVADGSILEREQYWIDLFSSASRESGYNLNPIADHKITHQFKVCKICRRINGPLRNGRCHTCNEYLRRNGVERPYILDGRTEKTAHTKNALCLRCGRKADCVGRPINGYCLSCYTYTWREKAGLIRIYQKICLYCGGKFTTKYTIQSYCCENHQKYANRIKQEAV